MRISTLVFILLSLASQRCFAQSFSLYYHDEKLTEGDALVRTGTADSMELTTFLTIRNEALAEKRIQAKKTEISMFPGTACSLCWAGYCYPPETPQTVYPLILPPGAGETSCFAHFITGGTIGTSIVRWTYFDEDNPADSVSVVIHYITYPAGIDGPGSGARLRVQVSPIPADREVIFRLQDPVSSGIIMTLHNLSGQTVLHETVAEPDGSITLNTSGLPDGIYLYALHSGGKISATGKVVVQH